MTAPRSPRSSASISGDDARSRQSPTSDSSQTSPVCSIVLTQRTLELTLVLSSQFLSTDIRSLRFAHLDQELVSAAMMLDCGKAQRAIPRILRLSFIDAMGDASLLFSRSSLYRSIRRLYLCHPDALPVSATRMLDCGTRQRWIRRKHLQYAQLG